MTARDRLKTRLSQTHERLIATASGLVQVPSANPPGDTTAIAQACSALLGDIDGLEISHHTKTAPITNLVAVLRGNRPGRRLVFNGHLDTYPVGDPSAWTADPLSGEIREGKLYGRGISDMKGGIACSMIALALMAECREAWAGELVLTLAGDEETMGTAGSQFLIETVPEARGDAVICGDAGSPRVLRFGEKGMLWLDLTATGKPAHGAHVHLGRNAIEALLVALERIRGLCGLEISAPAEVAAAIALASSVSEPISGDGETATLGSVTVNIGTIEGGRAPNLVADQAGAQLDLRVPAGLTVAALEDRLVTALSDLPEISYTVRRRYDPTWTAPDHEIIRKAAANAGAVLGEPAVLTMRVGASDCRLYRLAGMPAVVCGLTPHNMGGTDEYVEISELDAVAAIHTLTAFDFLTTPP